MFRRADSQFVTVSAQPRRRPPIPSMPRKRSSHSSGDLHLAQKSIEHGQHPERNAMVMQPPQMFLHQALQLLRIEIADIEHSRTQNRRLHSLA